MKIKQLNAATGGLSKPSKMPGFSYGIPAWECKLGSILRLKEGSTCSKCYALKGMYVFPVVKQAMIRRLESISGPNWVSLMSDLIGKKLRKATGDDRVFRWHDSGDIQDLEHLSKIVQIAKNLPDVSFWLPTRELAMIRDWLKTSRFPKNLNVRISAQMIGQTLKNLPAGVTASTVGTGKGFQCPAPSQNNECGSCRACWKKSVKSVDYHQH